MDKNSIAVLKDNETSIEISFNKIQKKFDSIREADGPEKKSIISSIKKELSSIKENSSLMKSEIQNLHNENNKLDWEATLSKIKSRINSFKEKLNRIENEHVIGDDDPTNINNHVDMNQMNLRQVMKRGDNFLDADDKAIGNIGKTLGQDIEMMKNVNIELNKQSEKLDNIDDNLKEIDYSLDRAKKQISNMFRIYSSDKCITRLLVIIMIFILVNLLVSALGGDNKKNFNVPHDIFKSNGNYTSNGIICNVGYLKLFIGIFLWFL